MKLPVKLISRARRTPMACGNNTVRPQPGMMPTREWVSPNFACSEAMRKSQFSASSKPPVIATPLTAPMSGFEILGKGPRTPVEFTPPSAPVPPRLPAVSPSSLRSSPAQNAGSEPVRMSTSTLSSASAFSMSCGKSFRTSLLRALRAAGRLKVMVAILSLTSYKITSDMGSTVGERGRSQRSQCAKLGT
ncbi:unannotated protein [freshwater metagenome]|uniref:Unannotated protein n=1 Tax=freshwater metagenome TaxID=449393 RepID=A0A6J6JJN2_9ZZZZ